MIAYAKIEIVSYEALYAKLEESGVFEGNPMYQIGGKALEKICMIDKKYLDKIVCFGIKMANRIICNSCQKFLDNNHIDISLKGLKADIEEEGIMSIQIETEDISYKDLIMKWKDSAIPKELRGWYGEWGDILDKHIEMLFTELPGEACDRMVAVLVNDMLQNQIAEKIREILETQGLEMQMKQLHIE